MLMLVQMEMRIAKAPREKKKNRQHAHKPFISQWALFPQQDLWGKKEESDHPWVLTSPPAVISGDGRGKGFGAGG